MRAIMMDMDVMRVSSRFIMLCTDIVYFFQDLLIGFSPRKALKTSFRIL